MKKILLFIALSFTASLAFSQAPDFQILNVTYTTLNDTLKPVFTLKADTSLEFTVGVFVSNDQKLDETDELRLFSTNVSQKNATLTLNGTLNFAVTYMQLSFFTRSLGLEFEPSGYNRSSHESINCNDCTRNFIRSNTYGAPKRFSQTYTRSPGFNDSQKS